MPYVSLQSVNYPDRYMRHQKFIGGLTPVSSDSSDLDKSDATFWITYPLQWDAPVVLRSANYREYVLRDVDGVLKLEMVDIRLLLQSLRQPKAEDQPATDEALYKSITFILTRGLSDPKAPGLISFRSSIDRGRYIRHASFLLRVDAMPAGNGDLWRKDATWRLMKPLFTTAPPY